MNASSANSGARGMLFVECRGSPREMGRQYGEQAREAIRNNVEMWMGTRFRLTDSFVGCAVEVLRRYIPEVLEEIEGLAEGAGQPLSAMLLMNHINAFEPGVPPTGCTVMALAESPEGPVLGKNNDIEPDGRIHVIRRCMPAWGLPVIHVANAGWLSGLDAMNAEGVSTAHASVGSSFDRSGKRLDVRLWMYYLARVCRSANEFLSKLEEVPLTGKGYNVVVLDARGRKCVLEMALPRIARHSEGERFVYATNHFITDCLREADGSWPSRRSVSQYRYGYLEWIEENRPPKERRDIEAILRAHEPWSPCRHPGAGGQWSTVWSMIGLPRARKLMIAAGSPCSTPYRALDV